MTPTNDKPISERAGLPITLEQFTDLLYASGWRSPCDAQHEYIARVFGSLVAGQKAAIDQGCAEKDKRIHYAEQRESDCRQIIDTYVSETDDLRRDLEACRAQVVELRKTLSSASFLGHLYDNEDEPGSADAATRKIHAEIQLALAKTSTSYADKIVVSRSEWEAFQKAADETTTIKQRDDAEEAADKLTSEILGEDIDWSDHAAKWDEAMDIVTPATRVEELRRDEHRLDWLEMKRAPGISTDWHIGLAYMGDLRTAIDATRSASETKEKQP